MEMQPIDVNSPAAIRDRYANSRLTWWPVLAFLPARLIFAFVAQGIATTVFLSLGSTQPWDQAIAWWPVYLTLADVFCLMSLYWLTRREGMQIRELFGMAKGRGAAQLLWTPAYLLGIAPGALAANLITTAFYGANLPPMIAAVNLPPTGVAYAMLVWPVVWVITEELVYLGYLLPRLEALTGRTWSAVAVVVVFWGLQHLTMPLILDATYLASRVLAATAAISLFPVVFVLGRRRLVPLIGVHYIADLSTMFLAALLPILQR